MGQIDHTYQKLRYSDQAKVMISNLKDFDQAEFEEWFHRSLMIGSNNILEFLMLKEKESKKIRNQIMSGGKHHGNG